MKISPLRQTLLQTKKNQYSVRPPFGKNTVFPSRKEEQEDAFLNCYNKAIVFGVLMGIIGLGLGILHIMSKVKFR